MRQPGGNVHGGMRLEVAPTPLMVGDAPSSPTRPIEGAMITRMAVTVTQALVPFPGTHGPST